MNSPVGQFAMGPNHTAIRKCPVLLFGSARPVVELAREICQVATREATVAGWHVGFGSRPGHKQAR